MYRTYNKELPEFLVNRPRYFVEHCKEKISLAMDIKKSSIKPSDTGGVFEVKSESSRRRWYRLQFGHKEGTSPSCECEAWQRRRLPCKHFFAIFKHFPEWNWEKLPQNYRNSPYLTLDYHLLNGSSPFPSPSSVLPEANSDSPQLDEPLPRKSWLCSKENVSPVPETAIPLRFTHHQKKSEGKKCRILLDEIRQLTFVVQDQEALANLYRELSSLRDEIQQFKTSEDGLVIEGGESSPFMRKSIKMENKARSSIENRCKTSLPKKKPKNRYTARVGVKAAMKRKTCFVHVPVTPTTEYRTAFYKETKPAIFPEQTIGKEKEEETSNEEDKVEAVNASKSDETTTTSKGSEHCERETDVYGKQKAKRKQW